MASSENDIPQDTGSGVQLLPPSVHSKYIALPLPLSPHTTLRIRITRLKTSNMIFVTTTDYSASSTTSALGSFVYAMPNYLDPSDVFSTALFPIPSSIDFATRVAKILARRTLKPTYVGCSATFPGATVEEELAGGRAAIETIMGELTAKEDSAQVNGT
ncbi:hypothetical protein MMC30_006326 [Trapelia coarctata]|nr:hypothetical protein [Trapelia coarctata]